MRSAFAIAVLLYALPVLAQEGPTSAPSSQPVLSGNQPFFSSSVWVPGPVSASSSAPAITEPIALDEALVAPEVEAAPSSALTDVTTLKIPPKKRPLVAIGLSLAGVVGAPLLLNELGPGISDPSEIDLRVRATFALVGFAPMAGALYSGNGSAIAVGTVNSIARTFLGLGILRIGLFISEINQDAEDSEGSFGGAALLSASLVAGAACVVAYGVLDVMDLITPSVILRVKEGPRKARLQNAQAVAF